MAATIAPGKRQHEAIEAVHILRSKGLNIQLTLIGGHNPAYSTYIRELIKKYDLCEAVHILGYSDRPLSYLALRAGDPSKSLIERFDRERRASSPVSVCRAAAFPDRLCYLDALGRLPVLIRRCRAVRPGVFSPADYQAERRLIPDPEFRPIQTIDGHLALFGADRHAISQFDKHRGELLATKI